MKGHPKSGLPFFDVVGHHSYGLEPRWYREHCEGVEHSRKLVEMADFARFFVDFLKEEVIGL